MPSDKRWLWREARLKDPDNNQLILYFVGGIGLNPPWRINVNEIYDSLYFKKTKNTTYHLCQQPFKI